MLKLVETILVPDLLAEFLFKVRPQKKNKGLGQDFTIFWCKLTPKIPTIPIISKHHPGSEAFALVSSEQVASEALSAAISGAARDMVAPAEFFAERFCLRFNEQHGNLFNKTVL